MLKYFKKLIQIFFFSIIIFLLAILAVFLFYAYQYQFKRFVLQPEQLEQKLKQEQTTSKITEFTGETSRNFRWNYDGSEYFIQLTLFESVYEYYKNKSKIFSYEGKELPLDWKEKYYAMFLKPAENDLVFKELAALIRQESQKKNFSLDKTAELALAFVQSIPYDNQRASLVLGFSKNSLDVSEKAEIWPKYPYEVLYEQKGICSDKSFLAVMILRELGFGTALFDYEKAHHMAIGIQCPQEYSTEETGYCYAETTTPGHRIGIVPEIDYTSGQARNRQELKYYSADEAENLWLLTNPEIYQKKPGLSYEGVRQTYAVQKQINETEKILISLSSELLNIEKQVDLLKKDIDELEDELERYEKEKKYEKYNKIVPKFNKLVEDYHEWIKKYNNKVNEYNRQVKKYNNLIKEFSILE